MERQTDDKGANPNQGSTSGEKKIVATQDAVFDACEQLYHEAENITRDKVSSMIGGGSPVVVMRYINEWREYRASENRRKKSEFEIAFSSFGQKIEEMITRRQADFEADLIKRLGGATLSRHAEPGMAAPAGEAHSEIPASEPAAESSDTPPTPKEPATAAERLPAENDVPAVETSAVAVDAGTPKQDPEFADAPEHGFIPDADNALAPSPAEEEDDFFPPVADGDFELRPEDLLALGAAGAQPESEADDISMDDIDAALVGGDKSIAAPENPAVAGNEQQLAPVQAPAPQKNDDWRGFSTPLI